MPPKSVHVIAYLFFAIMVYKVQECSARVHTVGILCSLLIHTSVDYQLYTSVNVGSNRTQGGRGFNGRGPF
jgi:hypothetical protein